MTPLKSYSLVCLLLLLQFSSLQLKSQTVYAASPAANAWADSVLKSLTDDQRIAQLMVLRLSAYDFKTRTPIYYDSLVTEAVKKYNIGGICLFQGHPVRLAGILNNLQSIAQTPILACIDAEWGVGMRLFDSVQALPHQMILGAVQDPSLIYEYGKLVGEQCKRLGIHVNYAPVVDINNNPNNPVINDRSFGEDKYRVAAYGIQYMKGMQETGVMACAKHFPGHGDVAVDSHLDLPVINKSVEQLDSLELYPFRKLFAAGVGSVMIAHLYIPAIDSAINRATSLSKKNITQLMRHDLGYNGLTFTDALEMQGVKKFFPDGDASVESLIAGNDMLCLPGDVEQSLTKIKAAIADGKLSMEDINKHCKRVLLAKYQYIGIHFTPIDPTNITADLNNNIPTMKKRVAEEALTLLGKKTGPFFPLVAGRKQCQTEIAYVGIGINTDNSFAKRMKEKYNADVFYFDYKQDSLRILSTAYLIKSRYKKVVIGIHAYNRTPANNFGISPAAVALINQLQQENSAISFVFGNPYAIKNLCNADNIVACYEDDSLTQQSAFDYLQGQFTAKGRLPVTVCDRFPAGSGDGATTGNIVFPKPDAIAAGFDEQKLMAIDSIAHLAIRKGATPGCVVLVAKSGKIAYNKAFGYFGYDSLEKVNTSSVYDLASVTKIAATTISIMKLYDAGKVNLQQTLGHYLPWLKGSNKAGLRIDNILLHQAGLSPYIAFNKETLDAGGNPLPNYYATVRSDSFPIRVAERLFLRKDWNDTMYKRIAESALGAGNKYVYSDNDFILLGKIVEALSGMPLNDYVQKTFYKPMGLASMGFKPRTAMPVSIVAPTEREAIFRRQLIRADVHDPGAAMFGGVAGHAGLFSDAYDLAMIMQMLLNGGTLNNTRYLSQETVAMFTAYHSSVSRRGYGFDKPEKDNVKRSEPYPCRYASPLTFGHTGFTGTCAWADPASNLVYIFLSNRVSPDGANTKLLQQNVRSSIHDAIYQALLNK